MQHNQRLRHEAAMLMAQAILDVVASCVHPCCHKDAFEEFLMICQEGLTSYDVMRDRLQQRLKPTRN